MSPNTSCRSPNIGGSENGKFAIILIRNFSAVEQTLFFQCFVKLLRIEFETNWLRYFALLAMN